MEKIFSPHLTMAHHYWKAHLKPADIAIDATCGNGHDTLFLSDLCQVIGIDIQPQAIYATQTLLEKNEKKIALHCMSHGEIDQLLLPQAPRLIVYNLGYLPRGDKRLTTQTEITLLSVKKSIQLLVPGGALSITCYPGHEEGMREEEALLQWASQLESKSWSVCHHRWLNRPRSPSLLWIQQADCQLLTARVNNSKVCRPTQEHPNWI